MLEEDQTIIHATGGGANKKHDLFENEFEGRVKLQKHDEMRSLVDGMSFVLSCAKEPSYTYREGEGKKMIPSEHFTIKGNDEELKDDDFDYLNTSSKSSE